MDYQLGSEGLDWFGLRPGGIGADRRTRRQIPGGLCHAVPLDGTVAVCGLDLALRLWADRPWELGEFPRCERCQELVPLPGE